MHTSKLKHYKESKSLAKIWEELDYSGIVMYTTSIRIQLVSKLYII